MLTIKLVDARKVLRKKCLELFDDERIMESVYRFLCDGLEECDVVESEQITGSWVILRDEYDDIVEAVCPRCYLNGRHEWEYCPHCGLKMTKEEQK